MLTWRYDDYTVQVSDDKYYNPDSTDNINKYDAFYSGGDRIYRLTSIHAIKLYNVTDELIRCVGVACSGGGTTIHDNSALVKNNRLFVCCADSVFCLELPSLNLLWVSKCDWATCFGIYSYKNDFIINGELEISKINDDGHVLWKYSDRDIFTSLSSDEQFNIVEDKIFVPVWEHGIRIIDADTGESIN